MSAGGQSSIDNIQYYLQYHDHQNHTTEVQDTRYRSDDSTIQDPFVTPGRSIADIRYDAIQYNTSGSEESNEDALDDEGQGNTFEANHIVPVRSVSQKHNKVINHWNYDQHNGIKSLFDTEEVSVKVSKDCHALSDSESSTDSLQTHQISEIVLKACGSMADGEATANTSDADSVSTLDNAQYSCITAKCNAPSSEE